MTFVSQVTAASLDNILPLKSSAGWPPRCSMPARRLNSLSTFIVVSSPNRGGTVIRLWCMQRRYSDTRKTESVEHVIRAAEPLFCLCFHFKIWSNEIPQFALFTKDHSLTYLSGLSKRRSQATD